MSEIDRIEDQIRRSLESDANFGYSLLEILDDVDAETAASRPIPNAHTIWEIVLHIISDVEDVTDRLKGNGRQLTPEEDWPPQPSEIDQDEWDETVNRLRSAHDELLSEVEQVSDSMLDQPILEGYSSIYVTLHGMVQHNTSHAGQIGLLKKAIETLGK